MQRRGHIDAGESTASKHGLHRASMCYRVLQSLAGCCRVLHRVTMYCIKILFEYTCSTLKCCRLLQRIL